MMDDYREQILLTIQDMIMTRHNLFDSIVNLSLKGELSHLEGFVDVGETYAFNMNHFKGIEDKNVQTLIKLCGLIEHKISMLMDENDIDEDELDFEAC